MLKLKAESAAEYASWMDVIAPLAKSVGDAAPGQGGDDSDESERVELS